jgi:hypothetical protein
VGLPLFLSGVQKGCQSRRLWPGQLDAKPLIDIKAVLVDQFCQGIEVKTTIH